MEKRYEIGGRTFFQKPLSLGQWDQLLGYLAQSKETTPLRIFGTPRALAIILREEGKKLQEKDLDELTAFFEASEDDLSGMTTLEVVEDFFEMSPMHSFTSRLEKIRSQIRIQVDGSPMPPSPSPAGISPEETKSSGSTPIENAWPG
jgi:hypothetical protein